MQSERAQTAMSDDEAGEGPLAELQERHRKEKKELREKIQNMKKAAKCGNKAKQKETTAEIERLEKEQTDRHKKEIEQMTVSVQQQQGSSEPAAADNSTATSNAELETYFYKELQVSNKNKKRQEKKNAMAKRLEDAAKMDKVTSKTSSRTLEIEQIVQVLKQRGLQMHSVRSDGDCLYNSIAFALTNDGETISTSKVRQRAADYIRQNKDDFLPFLEDESENPLDESQFNDYCSKVEKECAVGGVWGGEPELRAIANSFHRKIEVIQPTSQVVPYGEEFNEKQPLQIVFLRHFCALGEHYNATEPYREEEQQEEGEE
ncbi:hypothetical protein WR25_18182 [Diploscapter pachys]|uniref:OTU domain-containing protein n=1 Tax=Diploscapter pachys TaxID=2018661 RepID=A0A2A2JIA1_9BILA|nr:hypothetical protein WR25_18182 [Diploscapter pachys]